MFSLGLEALSAALEALAPSYCDGLPGEDAALDRSCGLPSYPEAAHKETAYLQAPLVRAGGGQDQAADQTREAGEGDRGKAGEAAGQGGKSGGRKGQAA